MPPITILTDGESAARIDDLLLLRDRFIHMHEVRNLVRRPLAALLKKVVVGRSTYVGTLRKSRYYMRVYAVGERSDLKRPRPTEPLN